MSFRWFLLIGVTLFLGEAWAQSDSIVEYPSYWDQYLVSSMSIMEDNLPGDAVYNSMQSSDGFVWLVCSTGIVRYDGLTTKIFGPANDEYQGSTLYEMHEDSKGNYWLPTIGEGLMRFNDGYFTHFNAEHGIDTDIIKSLAIAKGDTVWLGTYGSGIQAFYKDSVIATYTQDDGLIHNEVWRLIVDDKNRLWIGTNGGLSLFEDGKFTNFTTENGLPYNIIRGLTQMENGDVWVGTDREGIVVFEDDIPTTYYTEEDGLNGMYPQYFAQNPEDQSVWIAHHGGGIDRFYDGEFEAMTTEDGLISDLSTSINFTNEGLVLVGSETGVSILKKRKIDVVNTDQGLSENFLINVNEDSSGTVWVGTEGKGFNYKKNNGGWGVIENPPALTNGYASGAVTDREGNIWFNTKGTGNVKISDNRIVESYSTEDGLLSNFSRGIAFDYLNNAWIGTNEGVNVLYEDGRIDSFTTNEGLPNNYIMTASAMSDSSIWFGTFGGGAARFKDDRMIVYDTTNGLLTNKVYLIMEDRRGNVWTSGAFGGLSLISEDGITNYSVDDGLPVAGFNALVEDDLGNLWLGSGGGIFKIKMQDLYDFKDAKISDIPSTRYTIEDGFPSLTLEIGFTSTATKQSNGDVLFATNDGLAVIKPERFRDSAPVIKTYIDEIIVNDVPSNPSESIIIEPGNNIIEISYSAFNFLAPSKTAFRVKLSGINEEWVEMGQRKTVYYDFLPDGEYTFQVAAKNADGHWKSQVAEVKFQVLPPFYKTWWFILISLIGFGGIIAAAVQVRYKLKMNKLNRELEVQHKIQTERERISRDLHDNVGSQITNLITGLEISNIHMSRNENDKAVSVLESLDIDARGAMTELRETIWLLGQNKVTISEFETHVKGFINRQEYCLKDLEVRFENKLTNDIRLNPSQSLHLLRIIQEGLNNCRKHAEASFLNIQLTHMEQNITAILQDDGKGMDVNNTLGQGNGLQNIKKRVEEMKGQTKIESKLGNGTKIVISFPIIP